MDELFKNLESNNVKLVEDSKNELSKAFSQTKENWLVNGMMEYFNSTNSIKIVEILVKVQQPHDLFVFDKLLEWINTSRRNQAFTLFWNIVQRSPSWLCKVAKHQLFREMLMVVKTERNILNTLHGLFCIIILLPIIPSMMNDYLQDLFSIFMLLSTWKATNTPELTANQPVHLQNGIERLFQRLYGMYPWNFLAYLRENIQENNITYIQVIEPLFRNVKIHPMLLTSNREMEKKTDRWKEMEPHDVVHECEKFTVDNAIKSIESNKENASNQNQISITECLSNTFAPILMLDSAQEKQKAKNIHNKWDNIWSPSTVVVMATPPPTQLTHTPNQPTMINFTYTSSGASPPEAAIEATPETTPLREFGKQQRQFPVNSSAVRTIWNNSSQPSSPMKREENFRYPDAFNSASEKLMKMINDRNEVKEHIEKPDKSNEHIDIHSPLYDSNNDTSSIATSKEDEEVTQINKVKTTDIQENIEKSIRSRSNLLRYHEMTSIEDSFGESIDTAFSMQSEMKRHANHSSIKNDIANAANKIRICEACTVETQTDITLPIASHSILDTFNETSLKRQSNRIETELQLLYLQLQYERYRREVYAERNRRLLGKSRDSETQKIDNDKLKTQLEKLTEEYTIMTGKMNRLKITQNQREYELSTDCNNIRDEIQVQRDTNKKLQNNIESLDRRLAEETEDKKKIESTLERAQAEIFDLKNLLRQCQYQADVGAKYKEELQRLQSREVLMGEMKLKCSEKLIELANLHAKENEFSNMKSACQEEVKELKLELNTKTSQLDAAKEKIQIIESQLQRQKNVVAEQKLCVKTVKEEYEEKLKAVELKYAAQKAIILRMEESILDPKYKSNFNSDVDKSGIFYI